jgi:ATP-dependent Clp protease ATP-binding subunit ClpA
MRLSRTLEATLALAIREARARHHEYLCIEHVLYALLEDPAVVDVLQNCGGDTERLRRDLSTYLDERLDRLPEASDSPPEQTLGFQRILQRAAAHVQSAGREEIEGPRRPGGDFP